MPVITCPDPMTDEEREAWLAAEDEPPDLEEGWVDPDGPPPPGEDELTPEEVAEVEAAAGDELLALKDPKWQVDQLPGGTFRWTAPSGRQYTTEPTRYPI